jgi:hypothetical protein
VNTRDQLVFTSHPQVFSVLFSEGAGAATRYNDSISVVKYGEFVSSQIRRFIVVRRKKGFAYSVYEFHSRFLHVLLILCSPIFTYGGQGTKKPGVSPSEHAIAYSYGHQPQLLDGETELEKKPICVVMNSGEPALSPASRIYLGIQHPILYNVKVKDQGDVHPDFLGKLLGYWAMELHNDSSQDYEMTYNAGYDPD